MDTHINFMKLEKVELGGIKGNMLGEQVIDIFQEFDEAFKLFTDSKYNPLDSSDPVRLSGPFVNQLNVNIARVNNV